MLEEKLRLRAPLIVQFEITPACNNNCRFCYNFWQYDSESALNRNSPVDEKKIRQLMDTLLENEVPAVCFTGGEPFLAGDLLFELLNTANQNKMYASINTNGRLIDKPKARRLRESGLNSILISLHGDSKQIHEEAVGCYEAFSETILGIENCVNAGLNTTINYVSTQKNIGKIISTAKMLRDLGVRNMTVTPLLPFPGIKDHKNWAMKKNQFRQYFNALIAAKKSGLNIDSTLPVAPCILREMFPENYLEYLEILSPRVCMAGVTFMVVSPEGFNRACIQAPQLDEYGDDIKNFEKAWEKASKWSKLDLIPKECSSECYALSCCGGGCRTSSLAENNSTYGKTMYMGEPINLEKSKPFIERMGVNIDGKIKSFKKRKNIRFRKEKFGGVLANTGRQSFVILDKEGVKTYENMPDEFNINGDNRGIYVLYAAGILSRAKKDNLPEYNRDVSVIHASKLYPRLANMLPDNKVRMLRADTGERIYF